MTLEEKIKYHQNKYYNEEQEITDAEFDALWDQLKKESPKSPLLKDVGDTSWAGWPKANHNMMMGSQDKFNNEKDFKDWLRIKNIKFPLLVQHKLDGLSIELQYESGKLIKAVTRGDGIIGDDVTPNVIKMKGVPVTLEDEDFNGAVRGEIIMFNEIFEKHFSDAKNPRNMASGITKRKSGVDSEYLTVISYDVFSTSRLFDTEAKKIFFLTENYFNRVETRVCNTPEEVLEQRDDIILTRDNLDVSIDGIVLKQNIIVETDLLRKRPEYQRAFKFETEEVVTRLNNIIWQRNGYNYSPLAALEPVDLLGSIVKRASLANLDNIKKLGIMVGDDVLIRKANEIIPQILKVVNDNDGYMVATPTKCEVCETELVVTGTRVYCPNLDCGGRKFHRVKKWLDKTGVKGFGPALMNHLFDEGFVDDIIDLYIIDMEDLINTTNLKKATQKAFDNLYKIKELKLETFVAGFDIEGIGEGVVKFAVDAGYDTLDKLYKAHIEDLEKIDGFSTVRADILEDALIDLYEEMNTLTNYVSIKEPIIINEEEEENMDKLNGDSFCFTGKLENMTRAEAQDLVIKNGGISKSGVSKGLDYLVNNDNMSESSKNKKATSLGIEVITEGQFMKKLL